MKILFTLIFLAPFILFPQKNQLSFTNGIYLPTFQRTPFLTSIFEPVDNQFKSGKIRFIPSSYFGGITYKREIIDSNWSLKFSAVMGMEKYNVSTYNDFIDFNQYPEYAYFFEGIKGWTQRTIFSIGIEKNFQVKRIIDEFSLNAGVCFNINQDLRISKSFQINPPMLNVNGESTLYFSSVTIPRIEKALVGLDFGVSLRKNILRHLYVELNGGILPFNTCKYSYYTYFSEGSSGGFKELENSGDTKIKYSLFSFQFNLGVKF
jgi:hypothetical protein